MMAALSPSVSISATNAAGVKLNSTLPNTEAGFVNGVFSQEAAALREAATAAANDPAFVLPGTTLGIFPTGLIITSIWALFFISAVGLGTLGRLQFRNAFRRSTGQMGGSSRMGGGLAGYEIRK